MAHLAPGDTRSTARGTSSSATSAVFRMIWECVAAVPRGRVVTYGQVARMTGCPGGARTVGWAMRALPDDLRIRGRAVPWHRVLNAAGGISLRGGSTPGDGRARQRQGLRREGVSVSAAGVVDLSRYLWRGRRAARPAPRRGGP